MGVLLKRCWTATVVKNQLDSTHNAMLWTKKRTVWKIGTATEAWQRAFWKVVEQELLNEWTKRGLTESLDTFEKELVELSYWGKKNNVFIGPNKKFRNKPLGLGCRLTVGAPLTVLTEYSQACYPESSCSERLGWTSHTWDAGRQTKMSLLKGRCM